MRGVFQLPVRVCNVISRKCSSQTNTRSYISAFYHMNHYGFNSAPPADAAFGEGMITAVANTAFGDGEFSDDEKKWIRGLFLSQNYPEHIVDDALNNCTKSLVKVVHLLADPRLQKSKKMLIYDCFRVASVDGMHDRQKAAVKKLAGVLDISKDDVKDILELVEEEHEQKLKRIKILGLESFDELSDKFRNE